MVICVPMKAVILAAGKGTRMKDLTNEVPKPMLKVQGKPILEHILEGILAAGIREVFIVTGFRADVIESYFGDGSKWQARIAYGRQVVQDGTGKAPELAKDFVGASPFLLTYGDIFVKPEMSMKTIVPSSRQTLIRRTRPSVMIRSRTRASTALRWVSVNESSSRSCATSCCGLASPREFAEATTSSRAPELMNGSTCSGRARKRSHTR